MFSIGHNLYSLCLKSSTQNYTILVLGVDGAGKTTLINTLRGDISDPEAGVATFGRSNVNIKHGTADIKLIDVGGGCAILPRFVYVCDAFVVQEKHASLLEGCIR